MKGCFSRVSAKYSYMPMTLGSLIVRTCSAGRNYSDNIFGQQPLRKTSSFRRSAIGFCSDPTLLRVSCLQRGHNLTCLFGRTLIEFSGCWKSTLWYLRYITEQNAVIVASRWECKWTGEVILTKGKKICFVKLLGHFAVQGGCADYWGRERGRAGALCCCGALVALPVAPLPLIFMLRHSSVTMAHLSVQWCVWLQWPSSPSLSSGTIQLGIRRAMRHQFQSYVKNVFVQLRECSSGICPRLVFSCDTRCVLGSLDQGLDCAVCLCT